MGFEDEPEPSLGPCRRQVQADMGTHLIHRPVRDYHPGLVEAGSGSGFRDRACGLADHVEHEVRLRQHRHMTTVGFDGGRFHALRRSPFQIGVNRAVLGGDDGPARLGFPGGTFDFLVEQIVTVR